MKTPLIPVFFAFATFATGSLASAQITITPMPVQRPRTVRQAPRSIRPAAPRPRTPIRAPRIHTPAPRSPRIHIRPSIPAPRRTNTVRRTTPYRPRRPRTYPRTTRPPRTYNPPPRRPATRRPSWPSNPWRNNSGRRNPSRTHTPPRTENQPIEHFRIGRRRTSVSPSAPRVKTPRTGSRIRLNEGLPSAPPLTRKGSSWKSKAPIRTPILTPSPTPPLLKRYKIPEHRLVRNPIGDRSKAPISSPINDKGSNRNPGRKPGGNTGRNPGWKGPGDTTMRRLSGGTGGGTGFGSLPSAPVAPKNVEFARRNFNGGSRHDFTRRSRRRLGFSFALSLTFGNGFFSDCWYRYGSLYWNLPNYYDYYWSTPLACAWYWRLPLRARLRWHSYWLLSWSNAFVFLGPSFYYDPGVWCDWSPRNGFGSAVVVRDSRDSKEDDSEESSVEKWKDSTPEALAQRFVELGDLYFKTRRYALASDAYEKAIDLVKNDGSLRFVFADALIATGDYDRAAIEIRQGLILHPSLAESEIDKHGFYGFPKDFDDHIAAIRTYLKRSPYDSNARLVLLYNLRFGGGTKAEILEVAKVLASHLPGDPAVEALLAPIRAKK